MEKTLIVENLTKTFRLSKKQMRLDKTKNNLKVAVNDISFYTNKGEIFGLLGPNGAGKTTTLRCVATLIKPDSGNITVAGIDVKEEVAVKKRIAFLTNELKLDEQFTPNYLFNYFSYFHNLDRETIEKRKKELFDKFEINQFSEIKIGELSTGMKQKVSIVMSLVHDPEIIIFDEPTNGLDVIVARTVTNYLKELRDKGKTVIISTHIMGLVQKICDRVGIIIDGRLVLCDTVENVINMSPNKDIEDVFFDIYSQEIGEE
ncbi:MAG TPA: ATP-binding cassette domain-containing protein [Bacilli bacterium]|nr:ATP-binding cassette domain-containing protein [Bacilli bacterium]